jgi:hypothetical protein
MSPIGPAPQMTTGSPRRTPARSIPASATARGSHRLPSSYDMDGGSLCSHAAGCAWKRVSVPWYGGVEKKTTRGPRVRANEVSRASSELRAD